MSDLTVIDEPRLLTNMDGDLDLLRDMLGMFNDSSPKLLEELRGAVGRGDAATIDRVAHRYRGTLAAFFAQRAVPLVTELEMMGRKNDLTGAAERFAALEREVAMVSPALQKIVDRISS